MHQKNQQKADLNKTQRRAKTGQFVGIPVKGFRAGVNKQISGEVNNNVKNQKQAARGHNLFFPDGCAGVGQCFVHKSNSSLIFRHFNRI